MEFESAEECWKTIQESLNVDLLPEIERFARENNNPSRIVFGTSGWRGEIGTDFTFHNIRVVTQAIINTLRMEVPAIREALGVRDFDDVRRRGIIVGHDNRFLGPEFAREVMGMLASEGIRLYYAGGCRPP